jgi:hypothetical protein
MELELLEIRDERCMGHTYLLLVVSWGGDR